MTFDPPGNGNWIADPPPMPPSVAAAVRLMYAGAALSVVNVIVDIARIGSVASALVTRFGYTTSQAHSLAIHYTLPLAAGKLITAGAWLWMARENAAGRGWARRLAAVMFGLYTLAALVHGPHTLVGTITAVVDWLVALAATICLWRPDASQYFTQSGHREATEYPKQSRYF
jgi:hypothetical protein